MTPLALVRHGPTDWNAAKMVQGRADRPLSEAGRARVAAWRLPDRFAGFDWLSSPLRRCRETAEILSGRAVPSDDRLTEMSWGAWEGRRLEDLRALLGDLMVAWEARGLDFRAPGGESPREVQVRLRPLLEELGRTGRPTVAVCHKGVIRALYAMAADWDMTDKPAIKLEDNCAHLFMLDAAGTPVADSLNLAL